MALIRVNKEDKNLFGALTFDREAVMDPDTGKIIGTSINGILAIHDYIDDIYEIESERYLLKNVSVYKESFGSNEYMILYHFIAEDLKIKEDMLDEDIKWLIEEESIEREIKDREWYHAYALREAYAEAEKLVQKYKEREEEENEDQ